MCATDEVTFVDAVYRADLYTRTATGTLGVIDGGKIIDNGDSTVRTGFLTLHTTDTAIGTSLTGERTLIVVRTFYHNTGDIGYQMNDTVGAFACTDTATDTSLGIDTGNAILYGNGILRTNTGTVTVTKASEVTDTVARIDHICGTAGLLTVVIELLTNDIASTVTSDIGNHFHNILGFYAKNLGNALCGSVTARNTKVGLFCRTVSKRLGIGIATAISTSATVCARETIADFNNTLVDLDGKELCRESEQKSHRRSDSENNQYG